MSKNEIDKLLKILPKLIRENDTVKGAIISALSGVVATHEDIVELNKAMDKRFESMQKQMDKRFDSMQKQMDKRFDSMQKQMDKRFESMDKRFESMDKRFESMDKRFESMDKRFDSMQKQMDGRFEEVIYILKNIQKQIGKPFEQFCRNIVIRILKEEDLGDIKLEPKRMEDHERMVSEDTTIVEIDGLSLDPPVIMEATSILRDQEKIEKFLRKKAFVEKKYEKLFRGFFLAASTEFTPEEIGEFTVKLRKKNTELINL